MAMVVQLIREARKQSPSVVLSYSPGGVPRLVTILCEFQETSRPPAWVTEIAEVRPFLVVVAPLCRLRRRCRPFLAPSNSTFQFDIRESRRISALASAPTPSSGGSFLPR